MPETVERSSVRESSGRVPSRSALTQRIRRTRRAPLFTSTRREACRRHGRKGLPPFDDGRGRSDRRKAQLLKRRHSLRGRHELQHLGEREHHGDVYERREASMSARRPRRRCRGPRPAGSRTSLFLSSGQRSRLARTPGSPSAGDIGTGYQRNPDSRVCPAHHDTSDGVRATSIRTLMPIAPAQSTPQPEVLPWTSVLYSTRARAGRDEHHAMPLRRNAGFII